MNINQIEKINENLNDTSLTPLMRQYWELKLQAPDALLLFRMGDFYELFGEDAVTASRILDITLTSRDKNKTIPTPMAGVPFHSIESYLPKLLQAGKKVAIGEQMEEATPGKGIVRREIVRIFTPAIQFSGESMDLNLCASFEIFENKNEFTLALLEASTGDLYYHSCSQIDEFIDILQNLPISHFILPRKNSHSEKSFEKIKKIFENKPSLLWEELSTPSLSRERSKQILSHHLGGLHPTHSFFEAESTLLSLARLVHYLAESQKCERLAHLKLPEPLQNHFQVTLGTRTLQNLDLLPTPDGTPNLFQFLNQTKSALGARLLKKWIQTPLKNIQEIQKRQNAIASISKNIFSQKKLSDALAHLYDLERILSRINTRLASPRDTLALGQSLALLPDISQALDQIENSPSPTSSKILELKEALKTSHQNLHNLTHRILKDQKEDAPLHTRDGGIFKTGVDVELDRLMTLNEKGHQFLIELEAKEREATGIHKLKVKYNRVYGYYIEVTHGNLKNVPAHYQRKQSTVNSERYFTEELKNFEDDILQASHKQKTLEQALFENLIEDIKNLSIPIFKAAHALAEVDVLLSLSYFAQESSWCFPQINSSLDLNIVKGRHPLVEASLSGAYVPNTLELSPDKTLTLLVTGPNMGGKSTFMRQVAVLILLGQMGAPIPAASAEWGVFHSIYTRLGAHDLISKGQSTFMVEMSELASILHHANDRSFILLDEIGRGTSTYDGMSVAWAALEWICKKIKARTLFATHYHELTHLESTLPQLANVHMAVHEGKTSQDLRFLYEVKKGATHQSFGVHVAEIAGVPKPITKRAWAILKELESQAQKNSKKENADLTQLSLFDFSNLTEEEKTPLASLEDSRPGLWRSEEPPSWVKEFLELDLLSHSPLESLQKILVLQEQAKKL